MVVKLEKINYYQKQVRIRGIPPPGFVYVRLLIIDFPRMEGFVRVVEGERIVLGQSIVMLVHIRKDAVYNPSHLGM